MASWTWFEWLLLQLFVVTLSGCVGLGAAFHMSKLRVQRLQRDFKKLASSIGDAISNATENGGVQFEALLIQTQAAMRAQGLSVPWREVDPLHHPELMPLFLRCAVLELEKDVYAQEGDDDYWVRLAAAYDEILFQLSRDGQPSVRDTAALQAQITEADDLVLTLQSRVAALEVELRSARQASQTMSLNPVDAPIEQVALQQTSTLNEIDTPLAREPQKNNQEPPSDYQVNILSNIIDDQKTRIQNLQKELEELRRNSLVLSDQLISEASSATDSKNESLQLARLQAENEQLANQLTAFQKTIAAKDRELEQLLDQMESVPLTQKELTLQPAEEEVAIRRALVQAWQQAESSLNKLEQDVLKYCGRS